MTTSYRHDFEKGEAPSRVIALDWYDGPILGLVEYESDGETYHYRFAMVGGTGCDSRFFLLSNAPRVEWDDAVALLQETSLPSWPVWTLHVRGTSKDGRDRIDQVVRTVRASSNRPLTLIEAESIECPIGAALMVREDEIARVMDMAERNCDYEAWAAVLATRNG